MKTKDLKLDRSSKKAQAKRDQLEHYDIDGVTRRNGKIVIPSNLEIEKQHHSKPSKV